MEWTRSTVDELESIVLLEFGARWCGWCRAAEPWVVALRDRHPTLHYIWIEDGPGQALGRSFGVKQWPTFVLMQRGVELGRWIRPAGPAALEETVIRLHAGPTTA